jgi:hypothetical protein
MVSKPFNSRDDWGGSAELHSINIISGVIFFVITIPVNVTEIRKLNVLRGSKFFVVNRG